MLNVSGAKIEGIGVCVPRQAVANEEKVAKATGILTRRVAEKGTTVVDLCVKAAERTMAETGAKPEEFGAILFVSFTQHWRMPSGAAQAQARLGLPREIVALDVSLACSGWGYGLYLAGLLARQTGKKVLLLDGDVQSEFMDANDAATRPLLADGGTATIVGTGGAETWAFGFATDGAKGEALQLEHGGTIRMDGFGVFKFVATDVVRDIRTFAEELAGGQGVADTLGGFDWFVPHQPNVFMVRQLAKSVGFAAEKTAVSCDALGNLSSASVPATIAWKGIRGRILLAGFGGGLSVAVGAVSVTETCKLTVTEV